MAVDVAANLLCALLGVDDEGVGHWIPFQYQKRQKLILEISFLTFCLASWSEHSDHDATRFRMRLLIYSGSAPMVK
jgi:hypothetical protein